MSEKLSSSDQQPTHLTTSEDTLSDCLRGLPIEMATVLLQFKQLLLQKSIITDADIVPFITKFQLDSVVKNASDLYKIIRALNAIIPDLNHQDQEKLSAVLVPRVEAYFLNTGVDLVEYIEIIAADMQARFEAKLVQPVNFEELLPIIDSFFLESDYPESSNYIQKKNADLIAILEDFNANSLNLLRNYTQKRYLLHQIKADVEELYIKLIKNCYEWYEPISVINGRLHTPQTSQITILEANLYKNYMQFVESITAD